MFRGGEGARGRRGDTAIPFSGRGKIYVEFGYLDDTTLSYCGYHRRVLARYRGCIVLLTPGPLNETYFEHSYIARYLGFTLVEGADLTVRRRRVYLKTVDGLEKVDVILRRVDDSFCDPLELRGDSLLGVPGLVDAIVAGNVKVANALGSGLIETARPARAPRRSWGR